MVSLPRRGARAKQLVKLFTHYSKYKNMRKQQRSRRILRLKNQLYEGGVLNHRIGRQQFPSALDTISDFDDNDTLSSASSFSTSDDYDSASTTDSAPNWSDILGPDWRGSESEGPISLSVPTSVDSHDDNFMPDDATNSSSSLGVMDSEDSDVALVEDGADDAILEELQLDLQSDEEDPRFSRKPLVGQWARLRQWVQEQVTSMYAQRYEAERDLLPRGPSYLHHVLTVLKSNRPDHFRQSLRVSPTTFDAILAKISDDEVFLNNSNNAQMPLDEQLAITLFRFGHDGNASSLQAVANWAGVGKGTVVLVTQRVMTALLRPSFMDEAVRYPTAEEKEEAKQWVEDHSCKAWRGGWCMVDGTLVPLADKPTWFGESYFDRKCRYSLNVQIISLPNLRIIDFSFGHVGSTHDSTAWEDTRLAQEHDELLEDGEWVWADSAYPINTWIVAPYKKPERDLEENAIFNNHVSMVRIRSEHAIGYLKGRFHSLKSLRIHITSRRRHIIATYWIAACVAVHSFAVQFEQHEHAAIAAVDDDWIDPFIAEGLADEEGSENGMPPAHSRTSSTRLETAKACREKLKQRLLRHKVIHHRLRMANRREQLLFGVVAS